MDIINANNGLTCYLHKHDNEINHIYQAIHKINYELVSERFHNIVKSI